MKITELLKKLDPQLEITTDECENTYIYNFERAIDDACMEWLYDLQDYTVQGEYLFIEKDDMDQLNEYNVIIPDEYLHHESYARRPYYRMRGKKVTENQAFEIIRRTDHYFLHEIKDIYRHKDFIGCGNFDNWLIMRNHYPVGYGWIHTDGTVGGNAITQKYPSTLSFIGEWMEKLIHFPYLDLMIAVTGWDEVPDWEWDIRTVSDNSKSPKSFEDPEYDQDFLNAIEVGIHVHDKTVEILEPQKAAELYHKYEAQYGDPNREKYRSDYYENNRIMQVDREYLRRCIESYGIDPEKYLDDLFGKDNSRRHAGGYDAWKY